MKAAESNDTMEVILDNQSSAKFCFTRTPWLEKDDKGELLKEFRLNETRKTMETITMVKQDEAIIKKYENSFVVEHFLEAPPEMTNTKSRRIFDIKQVIDTLSKMDIILESNMIKNM